MESVGQEGVGVVALKEKGLERFFDGLRALRFITFHLVHGRTTLERPFFPSFPTLKMDPS